MKNIPSEQQSFCIPQFQRKPNLFAVAFLYGVLRVRGSDVIKAPSLVLARRSYCLIHFLLARFYQLRTDV